jgi:hypothetical protein
LHNGARRALVVGNKLFQFLWASKDFLVKAPKNLKGAQEKKMGFFFCFSYFFLSLSPA